MSTAGSLQNLVAQPKALSNSTHAGLLLQRKCACGAPTASLTGECAECKGKRLQTKLAIGASNDALEQEADRVADQALAAPANSAARSAPPRIQRWTGLPGAPTGTAPASVDRVLASPGHPLDPALRHDMGQRFGHDFANVRIHTDRTAADTAHAIGARAFTVGRHIAFADGEYTGGGLRLLAHELAHAVQQDRAGRADDTRGLHIDHAGSSREDEADRAADAVLAGRRPAIALHADADALQRQGKPVQTKTDVALVLAGDDISSAEGGALAPVVLRITSLTDLCKQVDGVGKAIGTMFVISHASSDGTLRIEGASGSQIPLKMANLAAALKKCTRIPHTVDFRGCKVGAAGDEVEKFRDASGVATVIATDCPKFSARSAPIPVDGVGATKPSQGPKTPEGIVAFDASLVQHANALAADNGKSVAHCLLGLPSGTLPRNGNILTLRKLYWANAGQFVASWASPIDNRNWQTQSRCMKDLTATSSPCARVEKKAPAPANSPTKAPTKNKGAMLAPDALPRLALDTLAASDESLA